MQVNLGSNLSFDANGAIEGSAPANDSTVTVKMGGWATGATEVDVGSFTTDQSSASNITIPAAGSASGNTAATPGVMSSGDKEKLDSAVIYTDNQVSGESDMLAEQMVVCSSDQAIINFVYGGHCNGKGTIFFRVTGR